MFLSHLTLLEASASTYASAPVFKIPSLNLTTNIVDAWNSIVYQKFHSDVQLIARHWKRILERDKIPRGSIIGLWLSGFTYSDVLHIYGVSRAGYIPQLCSLRLPNPIIIYELLKSAGAKALIYDVSFTSILALCPVAFYCALNIENIGIIDESLPDISTINLDDMAFVFHTSGSTSGSPKLVPCNYRWVNTMIQKSNCICRPANLKRQDVTVFIGSMCHIAQSFMLIGTIQYGSCVIQPKTLAFSTEELVDMIVRCGLNRLNQFATYLSNHLREARKDPKLACLLSQLDDVLFTGLRLPADETNWAYENNIRLRNLFGSTEVGAMLISGGFKGNTSLLSSLEGYTYKFIPLEQAQNTPEHQSTARLLELVIPATSPDCPHPSLRHPDGDFHTGDLFQEIEPGFYASYGREDDWIKSENSLRCDTKSIEENVRAMCGQVIVECIVVGTGRPSPVLFVETLDEMGVDHEQFKKDVVRKIRPFHTRRYLHERITSTKMVIIVPRYTLPRTGTKGNIRRQAVEEAFKGELDNIFGCVQ